MALITSVLKNPDLKFEFAWMVASLFCDFQTKICLDMTSRMLLLNTFNKLILHVDTVLQTFTLFIQLSCSGQNILLLYNQINRRCKFPSFLSPLTILCSIQDRGVQGIIDPPLGAIKKEPDQTLLKYLFFACIYIVYTINIPFTPVNTRDGGFQIMTHAVFFLNLDHLLC